MYNFPGDPFTQISSDCKEFIRNLLKKNPDERYSAKKAIKDPWISNFRKNNNSVDSTHLKNSL